MEDQINKRVGISMSDLQLITGSLSHTFNDKIEGTEKLMNAKFEAMERQIVDGFKGVHDRQDKASHGISKNTNRVTILEGWKNRALGVLIVTQVMLIPLCIGAILNYFR
jgi:hypothetical protein